MELSRLKDRTTPFQKKSFLRPEIRCEAGRKALVYWDSQRYYLGPWNGQGTPPPEVMEHKTRWRAKKPKAVILDRRCQKILSPFLGRDPDAYCLSPEESDQWYRANRGT